MSSPQFLIMGASGKTGRNVVGMLLKHGHEIRAFVRQDDERSEQLQCQGAEIVVGDLHDFMTVRAALEGVSGAYFVYPGEPGNAEASVVGLISATRRKGMNVLEN